ncbi:MAG: nuclear transport factor 2 family protein [Longimicrobiales bacterium]
MAQTPPLIRRRRRRRMLFSTLSLAAMALTSSAVPLPAQDRSDADVEAVRETIESYARFAQAGDIEAMGRLFKPGRGVHIIEGAGVDHGWEEYRDHHLAPELAAFENFRYRYFAVEPVVRGDVAYSAFRYELSASVEGRPIDVEGRGTMVLERIEGRWLIAHSHTSGRPRDGG